MLVDTSSEDVKSFSYSSFRLRNAVFFSGSIFSIQLSQARVLYNPKAGSPRSLEFQDGANFNAWMEISDRGADFLSSTASPTVLVWVLDALSEADLHPDERKQLTFLRAYRECIQERDDFSNFSNDELCILWRAFDRLQLLDRPTLLKFLKSTTSPLLTSRCHGPHATALPRYTSFSLQNWVVQAQSFRNMKHYPDSMVIAKSLAKRLMVEEEQPLRAQGGGGPRSPLEVSSLR